MRKHELEIEIDATAEQVWEAVATSQGIMSWFAPEARVTPGAGGSMFVSFGPGMESEEPIEIWEPGKHLRKTAHPGAIDFYIEARDGGKTVLRLVHSGFESTAKFDSEFDSTGSAWPLFMAMLKHSVEQGIASCRNVTIFRMLDISQETAWEKLKSHEWGGVTLYQDGKGRCGFDYPERNHAMLAIFCESCGGQAMLSVIWLLYGASAEEAESVRAEWSGFVDRLV